VSPSSAEFAEAAGTVAAAAGAPPPSLRRHPVSSTTSPSRADLARLAAPFRVDDGRTFHLADHAPDDTRGLPVTKEDAPALLAGAVSRLSDLQERLYAQDRWSVLLIFQAMDAAGKDGTIRHVLSGVNPQGCQVTSFKQPSREELDHDFLWRSWRALPERGRIGVFNRSYYEETLVVRVHPELLDAQRLPPELVGPQLWAERFRDIAAFEQYLAHNGVLVRKFFLHVSREEQRRRFLKRLEEPEKHWKFSASDVRERGYWDAYQGAYEDTIRHTATPHAPWYVVPADRKWFARLVVAAAVVDAIEGLDPQYPTVSDEQRRDQAAAREALEREDG
jgi:PPK2 family polyphosphate:nucleotide phosphotransferase